MSEEIIEYSGKTLKEKLDNIDKQVFVNYGNRYSEAQAGIYIGQWYKGKEVSMSIGVGGLTYYQLEKETDRHHNSLKVWHEIYRKYSNLEECIEEYVKPQVEKATQKWLIGMQKKYLPPPETPDAPEGNFRIIYADPPWRYSDKLIEEYGAAEHHYPTMSIKELCELKEEKKLPKTTENAVLFLWVTSPFLDECIGVIEAWGFEYKTSFIWDKVKHNYGHYNSVRHEFLLICTKGSCTPDIPKLYDSVQTVERTEKHSEKPEEFREIIDTLYPNGNRIELFARKTAKEINENALVKNWEVWSIEC